MKTVFTLVALLITMSMAFAQSAPVGDGAVITFEEQNFDAGDITEGDSISHVFRFTNTGNKDLLIKQAITTCNCTTPKFSTDTIPPGKSGEILVSFASKGKMGRQNKVITIISNALNNPARVILITNVLERP